MRFSLRWLRQLVAIEQDAEALGERLTMAGFELEEIIDRRAQAAGVVVGYVEDRQPHPAADKLSVCRVNLGAETVQIVCGATNVRAGIHVPVATLGSHLPAVGLTLKPVRLRGVDSNGMICSLGELGLNSPAPDGICVLEDILEQVPAVGSDIRPSLGLDDQILDLAITANRPDGLSMVGIAREVAALTGAPLSLPASPGIESRGALSSLAPSQDCSLFSLTLLEDLDNGSSPAWVRHRLEAAGLRSINAAVDVTNLVMLETGQPLHVFDADKLHCTDLDDFGLRRGRGSETLACLDGQERQVDGRQLLVTHKDRPVALAGVMGGATAEVDRGTRRVVLEAAAFDSASVRLSARAAGLRTDASSRFERGVPQQATLAAADRAVALLRELCGATLAERRCSSDEQTGRLPRVTLRREAVHRLLGPLCSGELIGDGLICGHLEALGCLLNASPDGWTVEVPASRSLDLLREVDLIEEVARLVGYDQFPSTLPQPLAAGGLDDVQQTERHLRDGLRAAGLNELTHLSLDSGSDDAVAISNPLLADYAHLRTGLRRGLCQAARQNLQQGNGGLWGFELGTVFSQAGGQRLEQQRLGAILCGNPRIGLWQQGGMGQPLDYFAARGALQRVFCSLKLEPREERLSDDPDLHPGQAVALALDGRPIGCFGAIHPVLARAEQLPADTYLLDLDPEALLTAASRPGLVRPSFRPYPLVPAVERDLALVVARSTPVGGLLSSLLEAGKPLLEQVEFLSRFEGGDLANNESSLAFRLRYRADRTLNEADIEPVQVRLLEVLAAQHGARLRG